MATHLIVFEVVEVVVDAGPCHLVHDRVETTAAGHGHLTEHPSVVDLHSRRVHSPHRALDRGEVGTARGLGTKNESTIRQHSHRSTDANRSEIGGDTKRCVGLHTHRTVHGQASPHDQETCAVPYPQTTGDAHQPRTSDLTEASRRHVQCLIGS